MWRARSAVGPCMMAFSPSRGSASGIACSDAPAARSMCSSSSTQALKSQSPTEELLFSYVPLVQCAGYSDPGPRSSIGCMGGTWFMPIGAIIAMLATLLGNRSLEAR